MPCAYTLKMDLKPQKNTSPVELYFVKDADQLRYLLHEQSGAGSLQPWAGKIDWPVRSDALAQAEHVVRASDWKGKEISFERPFRNPAAWRLARQRNPELRQRFPTCPHA